MAWCGGRWSTRSRRRVISPNTRRRTPRSASAAPGREAWGIAVLPLRRAAGGPGAGEEPLAPWRAARRARLGLPGLPGIGGLDRGARVLLQVRQRAPDPPARPGR